MYFILLELEPFY